MNNNAIIQLGNPKLRMVSSPVHESEFGTSELQELINHLFTMMEQKGGIGIAASQIGINKRVFVFGMNSHPIYTSSEQIPYTVLINPSIEFLTDETEESFEGCLSVGNLRGKVFRTKRIYYQGYNADGGLVESVAEGLHARVVQHEYDHLDGIVFLDRMKNMDSLGFHGELVSSGQLKIKSVE